MPNSSRVWIYQSDREITKIEESNIEKDLEKFCNEWNAHGISLNSSFKIYHKYFIVLAVNEALNKASGCSIDSSLKKINEIEQKHCLNLLNRGFSAFLINNKITLIETIHLESEIKLEKINNQSIFFNNLAASIEDLSNKWKVPVGTTWLKKYFNNK